MAVSAAYLDALAAEGDSLIGFVGLVDETGTELTGGSYTRKAVTWTAPSGGLIRPTADLVFDVPAGTTVGGWRGYSLVSGGTDFGGANVTQEVFAGAGQYTLLAASTSIDHNAA